MRRPIQSVFAGMVLCAAPVGADDCPPPVPSSSLPNVAAPLEAAVNFGTEPSPASEIAKALWHAAPPILELRALPALVGVVNNFDQLAAQEPGAVRTGVTKELMTRAYRRFVDTAHGSGAPTLAKVAEDYWEIIGLDKNFEVLNPTREDLISQGNSEEQATEQLRRAQEMSDKHFGGYRGANFGLIHYTNDLLREDALLRDQTRAFYERVNKMDRHFAARCVTKNDPLSCRPSLNDVSGGQRAPRLKPGWLWEMALKYAKGDPLQAMRIIGRCGHDDENRELLGYRDYSRKRPEPNPDRFEILCPEGRSVFFLPQGLGADVDISPELKRNVIAAQSMWRGLADRGRLKAPAAKYYHLMGAAFQACEMMSRGHSPEMVAAVQPLIGYGYRAFGFYQDRVMEALPEFKDQGDSILRGGDAADAKKLMYDWFYSVGGFPTLYQTGGPQPLTANLAFKPADWSTQRYNLAVARLNTYVADMHWTRAQHRAGGEFAARVCQRGVGTKH